MKIQSGENRATFTDAGWLVSLRMSEQTWEFFADRPGWSIKLAGDELAYYCDAEPVAVESLDDRLILRYDSFVTADQKRCRAEVRVEWLWEDDLLCCRVQVNSLPADSTLDAIIFPDVVLGSQAQTVLTLPEDLGGQIANLAEILCDDPEAPNEYLFKKLHMQVVGWEDGNRGLRFESHDADGWIRQFRFNAEPSRRIRFSLEHFTPRFSKIENFALPYSTGLGVFKGGWYGCAQAYSQWALQQPWAARGRAQRQDSYIDQIACWCWNRGRADVVCPPVNELAERIGHPVALDWYWWHKHPYDMGYPDYFPPREGIETFTDAVAKLQGAGNFAQVYTNGMSWDMELDSWGTQGRDFNIVTEDGEPFNFAYNTWTNHRLGHLCGASEGWDDTVQSIAETVQSMGLDGLYLDQIATLGSTTRCFSTQHGHLPGGGDYAVKGFRSILQNIKTKFPDLVLSSESSAEFFWDLLDANITLFSSFERVFTTFNPFYEKMRPIPFAAAVYHGRGVMFGNYAIVDSIPPYDELWPVEGKPSAEKERDWPSIAPDQFAFELARSVSFGLQPMVNNLKMEHLTNAAYAEDIDFLVELSKVYFASRDWLLWGRLLEEVEVICSEQEVAFVRRGVFTDPDDVDVLNRTFPSVLCSTWQDEHGRIKTFLINYTHQDQTVRCRVQEDSPRGQSRYLTNLDSQTLEGTIPPRSIDIIEQELV